MGVRDRIIYALEKSRKTRQALADELGIGRGAVSDMLNKEGDIDSIKYLVACEKVTGFRFEWLRTGKGPERVSESQAYELVAEPELSYGPDRLNELTRMRLLVEKLSGENEGLREAIRIMSARRPPEDGPLQEQAATPK